uniref:Uncharacterized protein n=1 Tax=Anopheles atroparvus TaxID=41427 RepID=A0AAG5DK50_ANOAO
KSVSQNNTHTRHSNTQQFLFVLFKGWQHSRIIPKYTNIRLSILVSL